MTGVQTCALPICFPVTIRNVLIMRNFAYKNDNFEKDTFVPELEEGNPCYQASAYDSVMYDETSDGDLI